MSNRRSSRSRQPGAPTSRISTTDDPIANLARRLGQLLPAANNNRRSNQQVSIEIVLEETRNYIMSLNREVDNLSDRLSDLLGPDQANIIRSMLGDVF